MSSPYSPKQRTPESRRDWYPYYAGYTEEFVDSVLGEAVRGWLSVMSLS
jgi:hypothetical protein